MNRDSPPTTQPRAASGDTFDDGASPLQVSTRELFVGFLKVGLSGFGGVLPFARLMLVERNRWLTERDFIEVLSLSQFLPGPNIVNMSIIVGRRFGGPGGATAAFTGLIFMPFLIIIALGAAYSAFGQLPHVRETFAGVAAGAAGLVIAMAMRMARPLRHTAWQVGIAMVAFVAIALFRWPMLWVLFGLAPVALLLAAKEKPR